MKKILQIPNYMFPNIGGIEQVGRDIASSLCDMDEMEQKIICFNSDAADGEYVCHMKETVTDYVDGVEVTRCGCFKKVASQSLSMTYKRELSRLMKNFKPDIVIFHYPNPFVAFFLLPLLTKETKLILWWHLDITKQKVLGKLFHGQTLHLLRRADQIIATSPNYVEGSPYLRRYKDKCGVIANCIQTSRLEVTPEIAKRKEEILAKYEGKHIVFGVGRHVPYKGMINLVRASKYLTDDYVLLIGGRGPLTESIMAEANGDPRVVFLGRVSDEDLIAYYSACEIFAFPSITKNEAFGIALAEGMWFGKPAVTFTIPGSGVNYVSLDHVTGIECENSNSESFAKGLRTLAENPSLRDQYGKAARNRVEELFTFELFKEKVQKLITRM